MIISIPTRIEVIRTGVSFRMGTGRRKVTFLMVVVYESSMV